MATSAPRTRNHPGLGTAAVYRACQPASAPQSSGELIAALKSRGLDHVSVFVGGVIPPGDWDELRAAGAAAIFPPGTVIADAEKLARERGWTVARADPAAGRLEATAYAWWIRFEDDVVLRVRPLEGGDQ